MSGHLFSEVRSKFDSYLKSQVVPDLISLGRTVRTATLRVLNTDVKLDSSFSDSGEDWGLSWIQGDSKSRVHKNKIMAVLDSFHIKPKRIIVKVDQVPFKKEDYWLHPYSDKNKDWKEILPRAMDLGWIGGRASPAVELLKRMLSMGDACKDNIYLQYLKSYTMQVGEVAIVNKVATPQNINKTDCMSMKRFLILMNAAWFYHDFYVEKKITIGHEAFHEMVLFMFDDPDYNTKQLKNKVWNILQMAFSLSCGGVFPQWNAVDVHARRILLRDYNVTQMSNNFNNHIIFNERKREVDKWIEDAGDLKSTAAMMEEMLSIDVNEESMKYYQLLRSVIGFSGYTRTDPGLSFLEQIKADENAEKAKDPPYGDRLRKWWKDFILEVSPTGMGNPHDRSKLPSFADWIIGNMHLLTNRSSGGEPVKFSVFYKTKVDDESDEREFQFSDISKIFKYMVNPVEAMLWENMKPMDDANPGRIGNRMVPGGKPTRAIFLRRLSLYLLEAVFGIPLYHKQMHKRPVEDEKDLFSSDLYTTGNETGNVLVDHAMAFFCTSQGFKFICELADFSSFDISQMYHNMRRFMKEGIVQGLQINNLDGPWATFMKGSENEPMDNAILDTVTGWNASLIDIAEKMCGSGIAKDAVFILPGGRKVTLDMVQSGEFLTLALNNVTNEVNFKDFLDEVRSKKFHEYFELLDVKLQGDDFYGIYGVEESMFPVGTAMEFLKLRVNRSALNGLTINIDKTGFSCCRYEYLKKEVILGMFIPLLHIQLGSTERVERPPHPVEWIRSFGNTVGTVVARGGSHNLYSCYSFMTWVIQGSVKITGKSAIKKNVSLEKDRLYYFPIAGYFTPISMGGVGQIPWCLHGASRDGVIAMYCRKYPEMARAVNIAATIFAVKVQGITRTIIQNILQGNTDPKDFVKKGLLYVKDILMPTNRKLSAVKGLGDLKTLSQENKIKVMLGDLFYLNTPKRIITNAIKNADSYLKLVEADKTASGAFSESIAKKKIVAADVLGEFLWITNPVMEYMHVDDLVVAKRIEIPNYREISDKITFQPCLEEKSKRLVLLFGPNTDKTIFSLNANNVLNKLRRDRYFPSDIKSESIMELLVRPGIFGYEDRMTSVLLAIGAEPGLAGEVARDFASNANRLSIQSIVESFSLSDQFLPTLNINSDWIKENIHLSGIPNDVEDAYKLLLSLFIVVDGFQEGKFYKMRVNAESGSYSAITRSLYGKANTLSTNILFDDRVGVKYQRDGDYF